MLYVLINWYKVIHETEWLWWYHLADIADIILSPPPCLQQNREQAFFLAFEQYYKIYLPNLCTF